MVFLLRKSLFRAGLMPLTAVALVLVAEFAVASGPGYPESFVEHLKAELDQSTEIDLSDLKPGELVRTQWGGRSIYVYKRTAGDIYAITEQAPELFADPHDALIVESIRESYFSSTSGPWAQVLTKAHQMVMRKPFRSLTEHYLVVEGSGPHSGCSLSFLRKNIAKRHFSSILVPVLRSMQLEES